MSRYTIFINDEDHNTVYEQVIESDLGLVKAVVSAVISYKPKQLRDAEAMRLSAYKLTK